MKINKDTFDLETKSIISHTARYGNDAQFRAQWLGFSEESRNYRSQQLRVFGELIGTITNTFSSWHILDFGCGDGRWLRTFLEFDADPNKLIGIDISDLRFGIALSINPLITYIKIDGLILPFQSSQFELVTQFTCFSSIPNFNLRRRIANEIYRVLKPGGYIFWWDLFHTVAPLEKDSHLDPKDYFDLPILQYELGPMPRLSECLRGPRLINQLITPIIDIFSYPSTHLAALVGPK